MKLRRTLYRLARLLGDAQAVLRDHPEWGGLALCEALVLPIIAILLFTPRFGLLAIPEVLVYVGMAGWVCSGHRAVQEESAGWQRDERDAP